MKTLNVSILIVSIGLLLAALALVVVAQTTRTPTTPASVGTTFTYQGMLTDNTQPANGTYDLQFTLYDAVSGGQQMGNIVTLNDKPISNGLFTAELDFGPVFTGEPRYLEIAARDGSSTDEHETLTPRQPIQPAPYAMHADFAAQSTTPKLRYFEPFQEIATAGAADWEFFTIGSEVYLTVANHYNGTTYNVNSIIYRWNNNNFTPMQTILTNGAFDWEFSQSAVKFIWH